MLTCRTCGKPITRKPGARGRNPHYCSRACKAASRTNQVQGAPCTCKQCGKSFDKHSRGPTPNYCSVECGEAHRAAKDRAQRIASGTHWSLPRPCAWCGTSFTPATHAQSMQKCCSTECRMAKHAAGLARNCKQCGKSYNTNNLRQEFCSNECKFASQAKKLECPYCHKKFPRKGHHGNKFCSRACGARAYAREHRPRKPRQYQSRKSERTCRVCNKPFMGAKTQWICSEACHKADRHMQCWARRTHYKETAMEPIDFDAVCERDHWTCGICGEPVDPALKWPNPGARSLDHIVPISQGGPHVYNNVQLTHLRCNWRKAKPHAKDGKAFHTPDHPHYPAPSQRTPRRPRKSGGEGRAQPE